MDQVINFLHQALPFLHILAAIAIIIKFVIVFNQKGLDVPAVMLSFFRIYSKDHVQMNSRKKRGQYMRLNNFINFYLYAWLFLTVLLFIIFHNNSN